MQRAALVTDATCDLSPQVAAEHGIVLAPFGYELGGKRFLTGQQPPEELYAALEAGSAIALEGAGADDFEAAFREAARSADEVLCACQSVGSTFTRVSAEVAARRLEIDGTPLRLISPGRSTAALAAICLAAGREAASGASADEVFALMERASTMADTLLIARDLSQLERSGQLAIVASQSNVGPLDAGVPLFRLRGRLTALAVHEGREAAERALVEAIGAKAGDRPVILVATSAAASLEAERLLDLARASLNAENVQTTVMGPVGAGLLGPGAYGLGFCVTS